MTRVGKTLQGNIQRGSSNEWSYEDKNSVISSVKDIIQGGDGKTESYDPNLINKVQIGLSAVSDYANGMSQEEMLDKYNSVPDYMMDSFKTQSHGVSPNGSMNNFQLQLQANDYGFKLSDYELDYLQENPGIQSSYLEIKKASSIWDEDSMEELMSVVLKDIHNGVIQNKNQLKVRLQNYLRVGNANDLDYLTDNLWGVFTSANTDGEKLKRIRHKYGELFGMRDRTGWDKAKGTAVGLLNGCKEKTVNGLQWLAEVSSDIGWRGEKIQGKLFGMDKNLGGWIPNDVNLWGINYDALSPDTKEAIDELRAYGIGAGIYSNKEIYELYYQAQEESRDFSIDKFFSEHFADFGYGANGIHQGPTYMEDAKSAEIKKENDSWYGAGEFVGGTIPELYATSKIAQGLGVTKEVLSNLPRWGRTLLRMVGGAVEGTVFSVMEEGEIDKTTPLWQNQIPIFTAFSAFINPALETFGMKLTNKYVKKRMTKNAFDTSAETIMRQMERNGTPITRQQAEKRISDIVLEASMGGTKKTAEVGLAGNVLDKSAQNMELFIKDLQNSIYSDLGKIDSKFENKYTKEMLDELFSADAEDIKEAHSVFRNAKIGAGEAEEVVEKEWDDMVKLYNDGASEFSLAEQEKVKENMRTIFKTFNDNGKPYKGKTQAYWRDLQISSQNEIERLAKEQGINDLSDRFLQESVLINAKRGFEKSATTNMRDILNRYAGRTLIGGLGGYVASETIGEGPLSNTYVATAVTILGMSLGGSPRASLLKAKLLSKLSTTEAYSIINAVDEGTMRKFNMGQRDRLEFEKYARGILYNDTIEWIANEMEDNTVDISKEVTSSDGMAYYKSRAEKYGLY